MGDKGVFDPTSIIETLVDSGKEIGEFIIIGIKRLFGK